MTQYQYLKNLSRELGAALRRDPQDIDADLMRQLKAAADDDLKSRAITIWDWIGASILGAIIGVMFAYALLGDFQ